MASRSDIRGSETDLAPLRERFGGVDTPGALMGMFTALGVLTFLGALFAAGAASIPYQINAFDREGNPEELVVAGVVVAAVVVFVSFLAGGWAAGRMARFDGGITGAAAALWALLLVAVFAALGVFVGAEYNAFRAVGLPDWFSQFRLDDATPLGVAGGIASVVAMFLGGYLGGKMGDAYNRRVDAAIVDEAQRV